MNDTFISGEKRPLVGIPYQYKLKIKHSSVRWEVRDVSKVLKSNNNGMFTFTNDALGKEFSVYAYYKESEKQLIENISIIAVKPLPGPPSIVRESWLDINFNPINGETVKYLDDIHLYILTANIPPGDYVEVKIWDKEIFNPDRSPGTLYGEVNEKGIALLKVSAELLKNYAEKLNELDWINDSIHQYYAEITYYGVERTDEVQTSVHSPGNPPPKVLPKMKVTLDSKVLNIENMADKTIPPRNGQKPVVVLSDKIPSTEVKPVKLKFSIYFDGTMNNKFNIDARENPTKIFKVSKDKSMTGKEIMDKYGQGDPEDSSYHGGYTNIAGLYELDMSELDNKEIKIYIEGVGSMPYSGDSVYWEAGIGNGIKARIGKALAEIQENVGKVVEARDEYVSKDEVCVFGFSRGATTARFFTSKKEDIALNTQGKNLLKPEVIFKFVGIFDTVSSVTNFKDDVKTYKMAMAGRVNKVLHLTAGNEFRSRFSMTNIKSSINAGIGYELELPGVHADIGGGYKKVEPEKVRTTDGKLVDKLISEYWHIKEDRVVKEYKNYNRDLSYSTFTLYEIERDISNEYRYIPLEIMIRFARVIAYGLVDYDEDIRGADYSVKSEFLNSIRGKLVNFAISNDGAHRKSAMNEIQGQMLKDLRHSYLHLSSSREGGHYSTKKTLTGGGRYDKAGNPDREIIDG